MLHIIYRSYGGENKKNRPDYYSKLRSLMSFVRSFQQLPPGAAEVIFLNDGPIPPDRLAVMEKTGEVLARSNLGNLGSVRSALAIPGSRAWPDNDVVWLSEDDYFYLPHALNDLIAAAETFPEASYFGLYALIGSRQPDGARFEERIPTQWQDSATIFVHGHPWRKALSTTFTFGARVKPLVQDRLMMQLAIKAGGTWDHTICLMYHGYTPFPLSSLTDLLRGRETSKSWWRRMAIFNVRTGLNFYQAVRTRMGFTPRLLVAPDPPLITHLESSVLALGTDWRSFGSSVQQWMDSNLAQANVAPASIANTTPAQIPEVPGPINRAR